MSILPDGFVRGTISGNGTTASVESSVSCTNGTPTGSISGSIEFFGGGPTTRNFTFNSQSPSVVATLRTNGLQSVGASFFNVTVQEDEFTPITGCTAYLNATRLTSNTWIGALVICCPSGPQLFVYGTFTGTTVVNNPVFCQLLL